MKQIHAKMSQGCLEAKNVYRDRIDLLQGRVGLLGGKDKLLMTMYLRNGNTFRQMARLAGVNEVTIARRIHKLTQRLIDGEYITCLRNRERFSRREMGIAKDYFLRGLSMKRIAERRSASYYSVRQTMKKIQGIVGAVTNSA